MPTTRHQNIMTPAFLVKRLRDLTLSIVMYGDSAVHAVLGPHGSVEGGTLVAAANAVSESQVARVPGSPESRGRGRGQRGRALREEVVGRGHEEAVPRAGLLELGG